MSVGQRLQAYLDDHGHSYRDAEAICGVSNDTIRRICKGYWGPTSPYQIGRIVAGYQKAGFRIEEQQLLEGRDPKGDFEWTVSHAPPTQRIGYMAMSIQQRTRLTLTYLAGRYPTVCDTEHISAASGLSVSQVASLIRSWESSVPDITVSMAMAHGISRITGISLDWFRFGWLDTESPAKALAEGTTQACYGSKAKPALVKRLVDRVRLLVGGVSRGEHQ